jgi:hypothetical protein
MQIICIIDISSSTQQQDWSVVTPSKHTASSLLDAVRLTYQVVPTTNTEAL